VFTLGNDYKWQPITGQLAILFSIMSFLTFNVGDEEEVACMWATVLGYILSTGCLWIGMYATVVSFQRAYYIFKFYMKLLDDTNI
jgi:hypothetical protein